MTALPVTTTLGKVSALSLPTPGRAARTPPCCQSKGVWSSYVVELSRGGCWHVLNKHGGDGSPLGMITGKGCAKSMWLLWELLLAPTL